MADEDNYKKSILELLHNALTQDETLRQEYQIGNKFRFIHDRLKSLQLNAEETLASFEKKIKKTDNTLQADETLVYIYLYNAQGQQLSTWQKMVTPAVFYEYSVNRPIYESKADIDAFIRTKANKMHHGYLTIIVPKADILPPDADNIAKDTIGQALIRVREGSLQASKMLTFTHNNQDFHLDEEGRLIKNHS